MTNLPTPADIIEDLAFFDDWEERYQYIIDLSKQLPELAEAERTDDRIVKGCQSSVWLKPTVNGDRLHFDVASDAVIVSGLLVLVLAAYQDKTPQTILAFDIDEYFKTLDLERHISMTRGSGLRAIVGNIKQLATQHQS